MKRFLLLCLFAALLLTGCGHTDPTTSAGSSTPSSSPSATVTTPFWSSSATDPTSLPTSTAPTIPIVPTQPPGEHAIVSYAPQIQNGGIPYTGLPALPAVDYLIQDPKNEKNLSTERIDFSFGVASDGKPHKRTVSNQQRFDEWGSGALAWDRISQEKVLYLTFDCGYEYENITSEVLDILREKGIQTTFFCTMTYLRSCPEVVARMIAEGHNVGNHSLSHPDDCAALSREEMALQALAVENYLRVNYGYSARYFRFPSGVYSENAVEVLSSVGYKSVFWSIAYADWNPKNQIGPQKAMQLLTGRLHPGAVILLHTTSRDNAQILSDFIDYAIAQGYTFRSLDDYPGWK